MALNTDRRTVDPSAFPDTWWSSTWECGSTNLGGLRPYSASGRRSHKSIAEQPDGLLLHENIVLSVVPPHLGMRQYWRDFESLERWARSLPHKEWWASFVRDTGGTRQHDPGNVGQIGQCVRLRCVRGEYRTRFTAKAKTISQTT
jgi:hypothetical protein